MTSYLHRIVGLYATRASAESARDDLLSHGLALEQFRLLAPGSGEAGQDAAFNSSTASVRSPTARVAPQRRTSWRS